MNKELHVALDTTRRTGEPEVDVMPMHLVLPQGTYNLRWTPFANEPFTFDLQYGLTPTNRFTGIVITAHEIKAQYTSDHQNAPEFVYTIRVLDSSGNPHNSTPLGAKGLPGAGGGGPTIKNN
jgi:hypothetical protein